MHITLHGRHQHLAGGLVLLTAIQALFLFHVRKQNGDGLLHHAGGFNHLRQKHLSRAEQVTDHVHARHQRPFDNVQRAGGLLARLFRIGFDEFGNAVDQRVLQPLFDGKLAPGKILHLRLFFTRAAETLRHVKQPLRRVVAAVQHHIFAGLAQFRIDVVVNRKLPGIDDAHIHADLDGVVEEHGMHRLTHRLIAAEGEGQVGNATGNMRERHGFADGLGGFNEVHAVIIVLLDTRGHRKHVWIEDNVFRRQARLFSQKLVGARADFHLALIGIRLPDLVKCHDHDRSTVIVDEPRLLEKLLLAFLQRNRIDDRFALHAFQTGFDDFELG